jgi:hypothetical protein
MTLKAGPAAADPKTENQTPPSIDDERARETFLNQRQGPGQAQLLMVV